MASTMEDQLVKYLTDAHAIEEQALQQLRSAPDIAGEPELAEMLRVHCAETETHERLVRERLEAHGADASRTKDVVARIGGVGFLLFARFQPDTPGKLASHAYSYEAMEWAAHDMLARFAERAGDDETAATARRIRGEEEAMRDRIASAFDRTTDASLRDVGRDDLRTQLAKYLADAHAIEAQAIQLLERGPEMAGDAALARIYDEHLDETRDHQELVAERLQLVGGDPSSLKDAAMRAGALNWGGFFMAQPDTPHKLAAFAYAFEHLEMASYEQLARVARRAGDEETAAAAERILAQEREAAERIKGRFEQAVEASLEAHGVRR